MSLKLFGVNPLNRFDSGNVIDANSAIGWLYASFKFQGVNPPSGAIREIVGLYVGTTPVGSIQTTFNGIGLTAKIRGASDNNDISAGNLPAVGTDIRILIMRDTVSGLLKVYANGVLVTDISLGANTALIVPASARTMRISGVSIDGCDVVINEAGYSKNALPTNAEALAWTSGNVSIASFAVPAQYQVKPAGNDEIAVSFISGGLTFNQVAGATVAPKAPVLYGAVAAVALTLTSVTDNNAMPVKVREVANNSAVLFVGRRASDGLVRIKLNGTYSGGVPAGISLKIGQNSYAGAVSETIGGGNFEAVFEVYQLGRGLSISDSAAENPTNYANFAAGDFIVINGQSNALGQVDNLDPLDPMPSGYIYDSVLFRANVLNDNLSIEASPGSDMVWTWAASMMQYASKVPLCVINIGYGGQSIDTWAAGASSWNGGEVSLARHGINGHSNKPVMIWSQGESDKGKTVAQYEAAFNDFVSRCKSQWNIRTIFSHPTFEEPEFDPSDKAIENVAKNNADVRQVGDSVWLKLAPNAIHNDVIHLESPRDAIAIAAVMALDMIYYLGYGNRARANTPSGGGAGMYVGSMVVGKLIIGQTEV